jgi:hypothetical protein
MVILFFQYPAWIYVNPINIIRIDIAATGRIFFKRCHLRTNSGIPQEIIKKIPISGM